MWKAIISKEILYKDSNWDEKMFTIRKLQYTVGLGYLIEDLLIVLQKHYL